MRMRSVVVALVGAVALPVGDASAAPAYGCLAQTGQASGSLRLIDPAAGPQACGASEMRVDLAGPGFQWRGAWLPDTRYEVGDAVSYDGESFIATDSSTGRRPSNRSGKWDLLAAKGAPGAQGPQGEAGPKGDTGAVGPQGARRVQGGGLQRRPNHFIHSRNAFRQVEIFGFPARTETKTCVIQVSGKTVFAKDFDGYFGSGNIYVQKGFTITSGMESHILGSRSAFGTALSNVTAATLDTADDASLGYFISNVARVTADVTTACTAACH